MLKHVCITFLILFLLPAVASAQNVLTGHVTDARTNEPLIGVSVVLKENTTVGTITDLDGNFKLEAPASSTLVFSYIGYTTQEVAVKGRRILEVTLTEDSKTLDEVVVVGYGTQKKVILQVLSAR